MIYLDSNALVKVVRTEIESAALQAWLDERADEAVVSSELALTEVARAVRRINHDDQGNLTDGETLADDLAGAADVLARVGLVPVDRSILVGAAELDDPMIRSLDAIHLISAWKLLRESDSHREAESLAFVTYDKRLSAAARRSGLTVVAPA